MKSLKEFIERDINLTNNATEFVKFQRAMSCIGVENMDEKLGSYFIIQNPCHLKVPTVFAKSHSALIDECVIFLVKNKLWNNVMTYGYKIAGTRNINATLHCTFTNSSVAALKGGLWKIIHELIGTNSFKEILINHSVFQFNGQYYNQIIGNQMNDPHIPPTWISSEIGNKKSRKHVLHDPFIRNINFLHKAGQGFSPRNILPCDTRNLIGIIFGEEVEGNPRIGIKRLHNISSVLLKLIRNHEGLKYVQIFNSTCPKPPLSYSRYHSDLQTDVKDVMKFLVVVVEKIFPPEMLGSKRNKSKIFKAIAALLRLKIGGRISLDGLIRSLNLHSFKWLGNSNGKLEPEELKIRHTLLQHFVMWIFISFVPRILCTFFYCTEYSSTIDVIYFRHDTWISMSRTFLSDYFKNNLKENITCRAHNSYTISKFNHGNFRVIPKKFKGEFRVIFVPFKGCDDEERTEYKENMRNVVKPCICVLNHVRNSRETKFRKLYSPAEIPTYIRDFKCDVLKRHGSLPQFYYIKFDIASCYESIPTQKALDIISRALQGENDFFVRTQSLYDAKKGVFKRKSVVNGYLTPRKDDVYIDDVRTVLLTKEDVMKVLDMEVRRTAIRYNNKCFLRKDGLHQGVSLSATMVDFTYDDLLEFYDVFHSKENVESLILRLADDFLVISTDAHQIYAIESLVHEGFKEYNAVPNRDKIVAGYTEPFSNIIQFCALDINVGTLEIWKSNEVLNVLELHTQSTKELYTKMKTLLK